MSLTVSKTELFTSGSISFSSLRSSFKETSSGSISASELRRDTDVTETDPVVPDSTENRNSGTLSDGISTSNNLKLSQFRNSIRYYDLDQGSGDTDLNLNISNSSLWNSNLDKNIVKRVNLQGTSGSTNGSAAASVAATSVYNMSLLITGSILGTGGARGIENDEVDGGGITDGGDGGDALSITTTNGTVIVRTIGSSAQVYGGGGGGGAGGDGGTGGGGTWTESGESYWADTTCSGNGMPCFGLNPPHPCNCHDRCRGIRPCGDGINYTLWEKQCRHCYSNTYYSGGGAGGDGANGGNGQGYTQSRTFGANGSQGGYGGKNSGQGGAGGDGGNGGDWGQDGEDGADGVDGSNGNHGSPGSGESGSSGGTAGRAINGSVYSIHPDSVFSAFKGLY